MPSSRSVFGGRTLCAGVLVAISLMFAVRREAAPALQFASPSVHVSAVTPGSDKVSGALAVSYGARFGTFGAVVVRTFSGGLISTTVYTGFGTFTPGAHGQVGIKTGQGIVSGPGRGFIVSGGALGALTLKVNYGNGAWSAGLFGGVGTPHGGYVAGPTMTTVTQAGETIDGQGCPP